MTPWRLLDTATVPDTSGELCLYQRGDEYSITIKGHGELMNSRVHGSEDALAELTCARLSAPATSRILIGGLGMGYTVAAALRHSGEQSVVEVAELVPSVVDWNKGPLGACAGHPLDDRRTLVRVGDVMQFIRRQSDCYDAILLDVDNGPEGLTRKDNNNLYTLNGLTAAYAALRPGGLLSVWSAGSADDFTQRLQKVGFVVEELRVSAHAKKGARHVIWIARRGT